MFNEIWSEASYQLDAVDALIKTGDTVREFVYSTEAEFVAASTGSATINKILTTVPNLTDWRVYDHSGAVTRIYSIYGRFVDQLIAAWLAKLPALVERYEDLDEHLRKAYQFGIGRLLTQLDKRRFRRLSAHDVVRVIHDGLSGAPSYKLIPEAFLNTEYNYHAKVLSDTFKSVGIDNIIEWLTASRFIKRFITEVRGEANTLVSELSSFIDYRNDAAHGYIDNVLGPEALSELVHFIRMLCAALREAVSDAVLTHLYRRGEVIDCGEITEFFARPQAVVAVLTTGAFSVGDDIMLRGKHYCRSAQISSIHLESVDHGSIEVTARTEVGLKLGDDMRIGLRIFQQAP